MLKKSSSDSLFKKGTSDYPDLEFHLRRNLNNAYTLDLPLFALQQGKFKINYHELQDLIHTLNADNAGQQLKASEFYGLGLISLLSHKLIRLYRNQVNPTYIHDLSEHLTREYSKIGFDEILINYLQLLPSQGFKVSGSGIAEYLSASTSGVPNRDIVVEELLVHVLALNNSAFEKYGITFKEDFHPVLKTPQKLLQKIQSWSDASPGFGPKPRNIIGLLIEPILASPDSIEGQLTFIRSNWKSFLGSHLGDLLRGLDLFEEENRFRGNGPGETLPPEYSNGLLEGEYYSEDSDWMPRVVMIARNSLVWLDQLSKKYQREIKTLQDIPDQELDLLAQQGFTVLWLIGLWHRSAISKKIKHWCGNPDAESSAYSLKEYQIDPSIGGPAALDDLKRRAWERGIRMASDMVPNHTGLDSPWLKDNPEWYITSSDSPFPAYHFQGGDLSDDSEISIQLEDHYYDRSDAAVVFKHHDKHQNQTRFVYHGNDGTSMPWNDTAQLNYLNPELREAVIQTILDVARQFKVIRFDAAMTLAKQHIQRLWYPEPGTGGDIPSRSAFSMEQTDFNAAIPNEFWREVVDRIAQEVPDTLLLAEAFWMMEGYFVRTLGMHRVYNSAFMNMLKMEENTKFFDMIARTLEFDPRILQRFVNFLSNPDEDTAIAQFGKGDKYFGATVLMVTLPGLPMFAHAQIEGFEEKYGMEYRRAYWNEKPDEALIHRHETEIFPLMKKRYLFAGAGNFRLFPMINTRGHRIESVIAYTNRNGTERALVLVNNSYEKQAGWIKTATPVNQSPAASEPILRSEDIIFALSFDVEESYYIIFQDQRTRHWYIRSVEEVRQHGFFLSLQGYEAQVYLNFQLVGDTQSTPWSVIYTELAGRSVQDFAPMFRSIELEPVQHLFVNLMQLLTRERQALDETGILAKFAPLFEAMLEVENISLSIEDILETAETFVKLFNDWNKKLEATEHAESEAFVIISAIMGLARLLHTIEPSLWMSVIETYELTDSINSLLTPNSSADLPDLFSVLEYAELLKGELEGSIHTFFKELLEKQVARDYFLIHESNDILWFEHDRMENFLLYFESLFIADLDPGLINNLRQTVLRSEFRVDELTHELNGHNNE